MNTKVLAGIVAAALCGQASAVVWTFNDPMTGLQETPPNASPGSGNIAGTYDDVTNVISYNLTFTGLLSPVSAAHFHSAAPGTAGGVQIAAAGFPTGVTSGAYGNSHVLTASQETQIMSGLWYFNIHSSAFPGGEIRGQITLVPAPSAIALLGLGLLGASRRRR